MNICHLTSLHNRYDTRIFRKQCKTLVQAGHQVTLLVNDGLPPEEKDGIKIIATRNVKRTIPRKIVIPILFLKKLLGNKFDIIHFHDPELIPLGLLLKIIFRKIVIYDVHENYLSYSNKGLYSKYLVKSNQLAARTLNLIFAEESYKYNYSKIKNSIDVLNYPDLDFFKKYIIEDVTKNKNNIFYIGGVNQFRGIIETINVLISIKKSVPELQFYFHIFGGASPGFFEYLKNEDYYLISKNIKFYGPADLEDAFKIAKECRFGISITLPTKNYLNSLSTKILEYMAIGLPQLYSDFEVYNEIKSLDTGIPVNPIDEKEIEGKLLKLLTDDELVQQLSNNSIKHSYSYSWYNQGNKLTSFYNELAN